MTTAFDVNTEAVRSSLMQREMFMQTKSYDVLYHAAVFQNMWRKITTTPHKCHNPINCMLCHWFIIETAAVICMTVNLSSVCLFSACSIHKDSYLASPQEGSDQCPF